VELRSVPMGIRNVASTLGSRRDALCAFIPCVCRALIGTLRRKCLDRTLFWTATDLEAKLLDFQPYYNEHRTHAGRKGHPPGTGVNADRSLANPNCYRWQKHCRGLYQTPMAA
jgi:Integrase core domain